jgi:hypothetical protein
MKQKEINNVYNKAGLQIIEESKKEEKELYFNLYKDLKRVVNKNKRFFLVREIYKDFDLGFIFVPKKNKEYYFTSFNCVALNIKGLEVLKEFMEKLK